MAISKGFYVGSSLNEGCFGGLLGSVYRGAVLFGGPKKDPQTPNPIP